MLDSLNQDADLSAILKRDGKKILSYLEETRDGRVVTKKPITVMFPEDYIAKKLASISDEMNCLGIFAIIDESTKTYGVMSIPAKVNMPIYKMRHAKVGDEPYVLLSFDAYDTFISDTSVISDSKISYWMYDYFIALGRVPWYMNYDDIIKIYDQDKHYLRANLSPASQIVEMIVSNIARNPSNDSQMYRYALRGAGTKDIKPQWVALRNITLGAADTYNKLMGSYFDDGLTSALADKSKKLTTVEKVLRS